MIDFVWCIWSFGLGAIVVQIYYLCLFNRRLALLEEEHMKWVHLVQQGFTTARDADVVISEQIDDLRNMTVTKVNTLLDLLNKIDKIDNSEKK
jgi:hypothetical protein